MLAGALVLGGDPGDEDGEEDLNVKAVLLDTAADAAAAAGVAASGAIILGTRGWYWLDPAVALAIAVVVGYHALKLVLKITAALRAARPRDPTAAKRHGGTDAADPGVPDRRAARREQPGKHLRAVTRGGGIPAIRRCRPPTAEMAQQRPAMMTSESCQWLRSRCLRDRSL